MSARLKGTEPAVIYPESDGRPMGENSTQFDWIKLLANELELITGDREDVCVHADLFWYPIEGNNTIVLAPDVMVIFGRPKIHRGSYRQWEEAGIAPQIVFEIVSPSNDEEELARKFAFYEQYGVEEYYVLHAEAARVEGYRQRKDRLIPIARIENWISPRLGIRFETSSGEIQVYDRHGQRFVSYVERLREFSRELQRRDEALSRERLEKEKERLEKEKERREKELLAAKLREMGVDPDSIHPEK